MNLQLMRNENSNPIGVFIPMSDWKVLIQKHEDLKQLLPEESAGNLKKRKLSELAGTLPKETGEAMLIYVEESRNKWEERLEK